MNLQYCSAKAAADEINITPYELSDCDIKGALINALNRIADLESKLDRAAKIASGEIAAPECNARGGA